MNINLTGLNINKGNGAGVALEHHLQTINVLVAQNKVTKAIVSRGRWNQLQRSLAGAETNDAGVLVALENVHDTNTHHLDELVKVEAKDASAVVVVRLVLLTVLGNDQEISLRGAVCIGRMLVATTSFALSTAGLVGAQQVLVMFGGTIGVKDHFGLLTMR